ncbi:MAG: carbon-nitrogen hydrolase family protein [Kiritimatiellia bacterium]|nr:carbon-nitrogen hydrolase family protein [Kiritimatiellia bacterium]
MARYLKVSTLGPAPLTEDPGTGQAAVDRMIRFWRENFAQVLPDRPDVIVIPECCDRFPALSMDQRFEYYEYRGEKVRDFFCEVAAKNKCHITYPASWRLPDGIWRNRVQMIGRNGEILGFYDKNHLVVTECTTGRMTFGTEAQTIRCDFGTVAMAICFDLNFEELLQRYVAQQPDLVLFCSLYHGGPRQAHWAYQCRAHLVSACAGLPSEIYSPVGHRLASTTNYFNHVTLPINLDSRVAHLDFNGERFAALKKKYGSGVRIFDPGLLGCVQISSETDSVSIDEMVREFDIEQLDDYWARSREARRRAVET